MSPAVATTENARDEVERLSLVLDDIENQINNLLKRTEDFAAVRQAAIDLAHAHKSFRHALMSVMTMQERLEDSQPTSTTKAVP